jgi:uncharacterized protein
VRVVFDTNVFFAAFVASGLCSELYEAARDRGAIWYSEFILDELRGKLASKGGFTRGEVADVAAMIRRDGCLAKPAALGGRVCRDAEDDWILATGLAAQADAIATGDNDLLVLKKFQGIDILDPRRCMERLLAWR